ncbi:unnamed protein product [Prunus armeniaca]|uniref:Cysteine proteinase inhibitor n=1 Tax=Prunus armeniaca TaxID=36596 RepID=A0A6J5TZL5_PRUAR|nr:unnamed protein product [Prunus armeniaca]
MPPRTAPKPKTSLAFPSKTTTTRRSNALLEFAGTLHHLTIEAIDSGKKKLYEAKVWMKPWPWMGFKEVQEFKHAAEICMNMECTRVAIRTGFSKSDAEQKYEKTHEDNLRNIPIGKNGKLTQLVQSSFGFLAKKLSLGC